MPSTVKPLVRLLIVFGAIAGVWLVALPRLAHVPTVRARIDFLEKQGIDPLAIRYTDLDEVPAAEARVKRLRHVDGW